MKWFGKSWGAPICDPEDHSATPAGACAYCERPIEARDQGLLVPHVEETSVRDRPWHIHCFVRSVGVARRQVHVEQGICLCDVCLELEPPPSRAGEQVVHILLHGFSLCGMRGTPATWPNGHVWCYLNQREHATCEECKRRAVEYETRG